MGTLVFVRQMIVGGIPLAFLIFAYVQIGHPLSALVIVAMIMMGKSATTDEVFETALLLRLGLIHAAKQDADLDADFERVNKALLLDKTLMTQDEADFGSRKQAADTLMGMIWALAKYALMAHYVYQVVGAR